jgi:hypothetical protein
MPIDEKGGRDETATDREKYPPWDRNSGIRKLQDERRDLLTALRECLTDIYARPDMQRLMGPKELATYERARTLVNRLYP